MCLEVRLPKTCLRCHGKGTVPMPGREGLPPIGVDCPACGGRPQPADPHVLPAHCTHDEATP